jgi:hypothetical protein
MMLVVLTQSVGVSRVSFDLFGLCRMIADTALAASPMVLGWRLQALHLGRCHSSSVCTVTGKYPLRTKKIPKTKQLLVLLYRCC